MLAYKVIYHKDRKLISAVAHAEGTVARYKIGMTTYPTIPGSFLFVFLLLEDAQDYIQAFHKDYKRYLYPFEAEVEPAGVTLDIMSGYQKPSHLEMWWRNVMAGVRNIPMVQVSGNMPEGTVLCNWIKLIRRADR